MLSNKVNVFAAILLNNLVLLSSFMVWCVDGDEYSLITLNQYEKYGKDKGVLQYDVAIMFFVSLILLFFTVESTKNEEKVKIVSVTQLLCGVIALVTCIQYLMNIRPERSDNIGVAFYLYVSISVLLPLLSFFNYKRYVAYKQDDSKSVVTDASEESTDEAEKVNNLGSIV